MGFVVRTTWENKQPKMISQKSTLCNLLMLVCNAQFPIWHLDHHLMTTTAQYGM